MATRTSGRNEDRSNARTASGAGGNAGTSSTSTTRKDASPNAQNDNQSRQANASSATSSDRERQLDRSREQGSVRGAARGNVSPEQSGGYPTLGYHSGSNPFAMMRRMMDDMDRLVSDFGFTQPGLLASSFFGPDEWSPFDSSRRLGSGQQNAVSQRGPAIQSSGQRSLQPWSQGLWSPQVEVFERGNNLVVRADLPGLDRDNIDVEVENDNLIIRGERRNEFEDNKDNYYRSERSYGSFYRAIPLPDGVDANACNATFKDGVLEVTLPKPPEAKSRGRKIQVK